MVGGLPYFVERLKLGVTFPFIFITGFTPKIVEQHDVSSYKNSNVPCVSFRGHLEYSYTLMPGRLLKVKNIVETSAMYVKQQNKNST